MTLIDLEWSFYVKIWSELGDQWVGVLAFGENCSEICRATHILSAAKKCSLARDCTGDIRVMELFNGITEQERQTSELYSHSQFSHMPFTVIDVCRKISKIQE